MSIPDQIGRHQIRERIGSGGFASVWRAYDVDLDADVAVKVLADSWIGHTDIRSRFVNEARVLRRADSDRVVRVHDIGTLDDGRPYFVMTYADGGTLADRLARDTFAVTDALKLALDSARGVAVLHELGFLHRDIKPSNVLFRSTASGERVIIADLGLAKSVGGGPGPTAVAGTPGYMAPEQTRGDEELDKRVDVYALGALTYQLLSGRQPRPFGTGQLAPPGSVRSGLPDGTDAVVMRALAHDRTLRWADAKAFASAVGTLLAPNRHPQPIIPPVRGWPRGHYGAAPLPRPMPAQRRAHPAPRPRPPAAEQPTLTAESRGEPRQAKRRKRRLRPWLIALSSVCAVLLFAYVGLGLFFDYVNSWGAETVTVHGQNGSITADVPRYWAFLDDKPTRTVDLSDFGGDGQGLLFSTQPDPGNLKGDYGITVVAGRAFPHHTAYQVFTRDTPNHRWLSKACERRGADSEIHNPEFRHGTLRTWTEGPCASEKWYGQAILRGAGYTVHVYMVGANDQGKAGARVFTDVAESIKVDKSTLPK